MSNWGYSFFSNIPAVCKNLILINVLLLVATFVLQRSLDLNLVTYLGMHYWQSAEFNPAQLFSYMFMHGGLSHLFFNMFALYMFGCPLEQIWGPRKFLFFYLLTGVGAGIIQQLVWMLSYQPVAAAFNEAINTGAIESLLAQEGKLREYLRFGDLAAYNVSDLLLMKKMFLGVPVTVGASGAVFGILLAFGWLFPHAKLMLIFFPVPIKARIFVALYGVAELFLGVTNFSGDSVAHFAHLGGMIFGLILLLYWRKKGKLYYNN
ncbi:MAG: rhomboid family intramembrane serine protease [Prevotellaceae bacterium]|jgi:membrane associated rhomboid family serine protease|nr:rhomboid family intramembrane serine protease [Prevotellaceae bacterium]